MVSMAGPLIRRSRSTIWRRKVCFRLLQALKAIQVGRAILSPGPLNFILINRLKKPDVLGTGEERFVKYVS